MTLAGQMEPSVVGLEGGDESWLELDVATRRTHFIARDPLIDAHERSHIAGVRLPNVPPCPTDS